MGAPAAAADIIVRNDGVDIHSGPLFMRVTAFADDILRVRAAAAGDLPEDASWAVPAEVRGRSIHVSVTRNADGVEFQTAALTVRIERSPLRLIVSDLAGHVISADAPTRAIDDSMDRDRRLCTDLSRALGEGHSVEGALGARCGAHAYSAAVHRAALSAAALSVRPCR
jgi:Domain of unknown function (DUF4968)